MTGAPVLVDVVGRVAALLALIALTVLIALLLASPALADDAATRGVSGDARPVWSTGTLAKAEAVQSGAPPSTSAFGEVRRDVPVRPVVELIVGVLIIVGVIVFVRTRKGRGRPR